MGTIKLRSMKTTFKQSHVLCVRCFKENAIILRLKVNFRKLGLFTLHHRYVSSALDFFQSYLLLETEHSAIALPSYFKKYCTTKSTSFQNKDKSSSIIFFKYNERSLSPPILKYAQLIRVKKAKIAF